MIGNCFGGMNRFGHIPPQNSNEDFDDEDEIETVDSLDDEEDCDDCEEEEENFASANPGDYYFVAEPNLEITEDVNHATLVTVTPKKLWDEYAELPSDFLSTAEDGLLNLGPSFEEVSEGIFGFRGKVSEAVAALQAKGMRQNLEILSDW